MTKTSQQLQKQTQLSSEGSTNKNDYPKILTQGGGYQEEERNTQDQTHPIKKISGTLQNITEAIMVELK